MSISPTLNSWLGLKSAPWTTDKPHIEKQIGESRTQLGELEKRVREIERARE